MKLSHLALGASIVAGGILQLSSHSVMAHGWSEFPAARQQICFEQGGLWSGTPPNPACAEAKAISGSYPWVQRNEFSINIPDYNNQQAVRAAVPDGTLCYGNDTQKRGFGIGRSDWTRTEVSAGTFEYVFNATAPHNPSFWEFYLTNPGADLNQPLAWSDLTLIDTAGNVPVESGKYRINVTIPSSRQGDATLFVRWQRIDVVGEGFYNCSDITIVNGNAPPPEPPIDPEEPEGPYLIQGTPFVPSDISLSSVSLGDSVNFSVFNRNGVEHSSFSLLITSENINDWDRLLAALVNGYYEEFFNGNVFIGAWHPEMQHYMYMMDNLRANFFNSRDARASGVFSITPAAEVPNETVSIRSSLISELVGSDISYGDVLVLSPEIEGANAADAIWEQVGGESINLVPNAANELIIDTSLLSRQAQSLSFRLSLPNSDASAVTSVNVVLEDVTPPPPPPPPPGNGDTWDSTAIYLKDDQVTYQGRVWTAQWWTRGDEPGTTGQFGVWR